MKVVGVRFRKTGRVQYYDPGSWELARGEWVIVESQWGPQAGQVVVGPKRVPRSQAPSTLRRVLRRATPEDLESGRRWQLKESEAFRIGLEKIRQHQLPMRLVDAEYTFDGGRLTLYFRAEGRVDFRELVRDLASTFHTRIELRQIGARDAAKMVGGIGPCGLSTCCSTFLTGFHPVTIRMVKGQRLALNPERLSGLCGRLMCCLAFELDSSDANGEAPGTAEVASGDSQEQAPDEPDEMQPPAAQAEREAACGQEPQGAPSSALEQVSSEAGGQPPPQQPSRPRRARRRGRRRRSGRPGP